VLLPIKLAAGRVVVLFWSHYWAPVGVDDPFVFGDIVLQALEREGITWRLRSILFESRATLLGFWISVAHVPLLAGRLPGRVQDFRLNIIKLKLMLSEKGVESNERSRVKRENLNEAEEAKTA
jgi:hypothetical protein